MDEFVFYIKYNVRIPMDRIKKYLKSNATNTYSFIKKVYTSIYNLFYDSSAFWKHR